MQHQHSMNTYIIYCLIFLTALRRKLEMLMPYRCVVDVVSALTSQKLEKHFCRDHAWIPQQKWFFSECFPTPSLRQTLRSVISITHSGFLDRGAHYVHQVPHTDLNWPGTLAVTRRALHRPACSTPLLTLHPPSLAPGRSVLRRSPTFNYSCARNPTPGKAQSQVTWCDEACTEMETTGRTHVHMIVWKDMQKGEWSHLTWGLK